MSESYTKKLRDAAILVLQTPNTGDRTIIVDADALRTLLFVVQEYLPEIDVDGVATGDD